MAYLLLSPLPLSQRERERERERQYLNSAARNAALRKISEYMLARIHVFSESVNFWPMRK